MQIFCDNLENLKNLHRCKKMTTLWIVGRIINDGPEWEIVGVYDSEKMAICACKTGSYFVGPIQINQTIEDGAESLQGFYYPLIDSQGE